MDAVAEAMLFAIVAIILWAIVEVIVLWPRRPKGRR